MYWPREQISKTVKRLLSEEGYQLLEITMGADRHLAIVLDDEPSLPISVRDCVRATEIVQSSLLELSIQPKAVNIEVRSPGSSRLLQTVDHFRRFQGSRVTLKTSKNGNGRARYTGLLVSGDDEEVRLAVDGREHKFALDHIQEVRLKS